MRTLPFCKTGRSGRNAAKAGTAYEKADMWDSYTQIRGGLTQEDYVAFPYGRDVVSGAKTEESTVAVQYGG